MVELFESEALARMSDDDLMTRCASNNEFAFKELVGRYERPVLATCRRLVSAPGAAEDAAQDTFLELWRQRHRYTGRGQFRPYLFTLCLNVCRHTRRSSWRWRRRNQAFANEAPDFTHATPESEAVRVQHQGALLEAVGRLPRKQREAITLRFFSELSYEELAESTGASQSTLRSRVQHGLRFLARDLSRRENR